MPKKLSLKHDNLPESEFEDLNLAGARFTNINLSKARFHDINFSDVHFSVAQLGGTVFTDIGLPPHIEEKQERQRPVTFEAATLCDSVFRKVDLSNVRIIDCNLEGMTIDGVLVTDLLKAHQQLAG
jgi:uncharacterized protein YjbI with pentapeptide repeats